MGGINWVEQCAFGEHGSVSLKDTPYHQILNMILQDIETFISRILGSRRNLLINPEINWTRYVMRKYQSAGQTRQSMYKMDHIKTCANTRKPTRDILDASSSHINPSRSTSIIRALRFYMAENSSSQG